MLIDAGLSPRATNRKLLALGLSLDHISAILLTHIDTDHCYPGWRRVLAKRPRLALHLHRRHRNIAWRLGLTARHVQLFEAEINVFDCVRCECVLNAHDDLGSTGFIINANGLRLGYATDLGTVSPTLLSRFTNLDALAIESNYDRQMQLDSARPWFLKRRIMGGAGHLSNEQAIEAIRRIDACSTLSHVALLHLSRQCNCPDLLKALFAERLPHLVDRLTITNQRRATPVLQVRRSCESIGQRAAGEVKGLGEINPAFSRRLAAELATGQLPLFAH